MATIKITSDINQVAATLSDISSKAVKPAANTAINKTLSLAKKRLVNKMNGVTGIKKGDLNHRTKIYKASRRFPSGLLWFSLNPYPASRVGSARETRTGVKVKGKTHSGAFISTMPSGHIGIFIRKGKARLPIKEVMIDIKGPYKAMEDDLLRFSNEKFNFLFTAELNRRLSRIRKR